MPNRFATGGNSRLLWKRWTAIEELLHEKQTEYRGMRVAGSTKPVLFRPRGQCYVTKTSRPTGPCCVHTLPLRCNAPWRARGGGGGKEVQRWWPFGRIAFWFKDERWHWQCRFSRWRIYKLENKHFCLKLQELVTHMMNSDLLYRPISVASITFKTLVYLCLGLGTKMTAQTWSRHYCVILLFELNVFYGLVKFTIFLIYVFLVTSNRPI